MTIDRTAQLQHWLERMHDGDEAARQELIACAYERLRLLARRIFHDDFPRLRNLHETDSIVHESASRLLNALKEVRPPTVRDFFTFAAAQMRRVLLDMARRPKPPAGLADEQVGQDSTHDPAKIAVWTEFHEKVQQLPDKERAVVDLYLYQGLSQAETARLLELHEKEVSRLWLRARMKLADRVPGWEGLLGGGSDHD
jgi:RNA polymerase sigma-70 factor (ECF subfamily)